MPLMESAAPDAELETFRQQWLSDLRNRKGHETHSEDTVRNGQATFSFSEAPRPHHPSDEHPHPPPRVHLYDEYLQTRPYQDDLPTSGHTLQEESDSEVEDEKQLVSALDHFEEAMEKEAQGNMGSSLTLYRKAYRMDHKVDQSYKEKHFPKGAAPAAHTAHTIHKTAKAKSRDPAVPPPAQPPAQQPQKQHPPKSNAEPRPTIDDLLSSFTGLAITPAPAPIEGDVPPPCPIADLPEEILVHILRDVAIDDFGDFVRLSRACRRFALLVAREQRIWRRVAVGSEVGFGAMHYHFACPLDWDLDPTRNRQRQADRESEPVAIEGDGSVLTAGALAARRRQQSHELTLSLVPSAAYPSWRSLMRSRPRVRFNGVYINTVNYVRSGQASTNQATWGGSPIHIVTYYRYLRFFRDGTCISLLTTQEPVDVVHHITRENMRLHRKKGAPGGTGGGGGGGGGPAGTALNAHLPSTVMHLALRGRWRLSSPLTLAKDAAVPDIVHYHSQPPPPPLPDQREEEGDLYVETEGVGREYVYRMDLALRSTGRTKAGAPTQQQHHHNNKIVWRAFYSHHGGKNMWDEFRVKNDKPYVFSRVKSYGKGE